LAAMKRVVTSILIILGCIVFVPNTHPGPSPSPFRRENSPPRNLTGGASQAPAKRVIWSAQAGSLANRPMYPVGQSQGKLVGRKNSTEPAVTKNDRLYLGRNDGKVQQSTAVGKPSPRNLTTNPKRSSGITANAAPPSFVGRSSGVAKQTGAGAHKTKGPQQIATQGGQTTSGRGGSPAVQLNRFSNSQFGTPKGSPTPRPSLDRQPQYISTMQTSLPSGKGKGGKVSPTPHPR
jgi:hypothetical protein